MLDRNRYMEGPIVDYYLEALDIADHHLAHAVHSIDGQFAHLGPAYADTHPELVAAYLTLVAQAMRGVVISRDLEREKDIVAKKG